MATPTAASSSNIAPRIVYEDLREWLDEARKLGEVKEVKRALLAAGHRHGCGDRAA